MSDDRICDVCGEPKSAHVATEAGPLTHPREARGEGRYELVRAGYWMAGSWPGDEDVPVAPFYRFVKRTEGGG